MGISFLILPVYVVFDTVKTPFIHEAPYTSLVGIVLAVLSLIVMPLLARSKRLEAVNLESRVIKTDPR
jgi:hypothetical protein